MNQNMNESKSEAPGESAPAEADVIAFGNELALGEDGWAQLAPLGDYPGQALIRQADGTYTRTPAIQRLDRAAAEGMVRRFKSFGQRLRRFLTGCPIYVGHPDVPACAHEYPDREPKGMIVDLAVRADGLYCRPVFTSAGSDLVEGKKLRALSGYWSAVPVPATANIYRPDLLKSAGLTNRPNLPVHLLNEQPGDRGFAPPSPVPAQLMNQNLILPLLTRHGIPLAADAGEADLAAALQQISDRAQAAATLANEKTAAEARLETLTASHLALTEAFANERAARITSFLDAAQVAGRLTAAERPDWERRLGEATQFANECAALARVAPRLKTVSLVEREGGQRKAELANAADRRDAIRTLVNAELALNGGHYDAAWEKVRQANPALFEAMIQPALK